MTTKKNAFLFNERHCLVGLLITVCFVLLSARLIHLMMIQSHFLKAQGNARSLRIFKLPAYRGMITDRYGEPLAVSTAVSAIWTNPHDLNLQDPNLNKAIEGLGYDKKSFLQLIQKNKSKEFLYLKRGLSPKATKAIETLHIKGLYQLREFRRFYPEGESTAHLIGFTNIDGMGQEGLELAFEPWLSGKAGKKRVLTDRLGHIMADVDRLTIPEPGHDLALSIDRRIQYIAYRELKSAVKRFSAHSGTAIIMNVHTGEVLAMANYPAFNPNQRYKATTEFYRNRAVTDVFEPGSVMKPFSIASALLSQKFRPNSIIDTSPNRIRLGGHWIVDEKAFGPLTVSEILIYSSNVGITKLILASDKSNLLHLLKCCGFGQITQSNFPGESAGYFQPEQIQHPFVLATVGFGYGLSVTPLQLTQAFSLFGNNGQAVAATLLKRNTTPSAQKQIFSPVIAQQVLRMLEQVVIKGTGRNAKVPGYRVAGKTGTARLAGPHGYDKTRHISSFVGLVPASAPKLTIAITLNEPHHQYYASQTTAPLFRKIATDALRILNIIPDQIS